MRKGAAPPSDHWPDFLNPIELRSAELAEMSVDAVQPSGPYLARRRRQLLEVLVRPVLCEDAAYLACVRHSSIGDSLIVGCMELWSAKRCIDAGASPPGIDVGFPLGLDDMKALKLYRSHASPRTLPTP